MIRSKLNKRKRKKYRKGEFSETGFSVTFYHILNKDNILLDKFIELVETKGMYCGGGGSENKSSFFVSRNKKVITEPERIEFLENLKKIDGIEHIICLELQDPWYGDSDEYFKKLGELEKNYENER